MSRVGSAASAVIAGWAVVFLCSVVQASEAPLLGDAPNPDRVLFVGNSFTYYNNSLHAHVRAIVDDRELAADGKNDEDRKFRALTISGGRLDEHLLGARGLIAQGAQGKKPRPWDVVVLQGHSREALSKESSQRFAESAATLDAWVREAGGRTVLFMTWAYADRPEMTPVVDDVYTRVGNRLAARVAPVGLAFARMRSDRPELELHTEDKIHPTLLGSYLAANVFYATLYGRTPVGTNYTAGLDPEVAALAQTVAWQVVQEYRTR